MSPDEAKVKREAAIEGMVAKGYDREVAERLLGMIGRALFGPGGRFEITPDAPTATTQPEATT